MRWLPLLLALLLPSAALADGLGSFVSPGPLAEGHKDLDSILKCVKCHEPGAGVTADRCLACHDTVQDQIDRRAGFHADRDNNCQGCHPDHRGLGFSLTQLDEDAFNHQSTGFALRGKHAPLKCAKCHEDAPDDFTGLESSCVSCHEDPHGATESTRPLLSACRTCHDDADWENAEDVGEEIFDHTDPAQVDYTLHGQHTRVDCESCHVDARFVPTASETCTDCHKDPHRGQFRGRDCESCHTVEQKKFRIPRFDHAIWPLKGAHGDVSCAKCHGRGKAARYRPLAHQNCRDCHEDVHKGQFDPRDCDSCHSTDRGGFTEGVVDHDTTDFPLHGAHADVGCEDCHGEGKGARFADLPHDSCSTCHDDIHEGRFKPKTCEDCHSDDAWTVEDFDHGQTDFKLDGAHADAPCESCHGEGEARKITGLAFETCLDCHRDDDPHEGHLKAQTCTRCHVTAKWDDVRFDHARVWELEGEHQDVACEDCHRDKAFRGAEKDCSSCHEDDRPPDHYEGDCATCHAPSGWSEATLGDLGHDATGFPLEGAHATLLCLDCHAGREPKAATGPTCMGCHGADDPHRNLLGDHCEDCHRTDEWLRTTFRHAVTGFQLRGAHAVAACQECHARTFAGTSQNCSFCHGMQKPGDTLHNDPLTNDCELCHQEDSWENANFSFGGTR